MAINEKEKKFIHTKHPDEIKKLYDWFEADRTAKMAIQKEFEEAYKIWSGAHWDLNDSLGYPLRTEKQKQSRPNTVENVIFSLIEGLVAEFSEEMDIIDHPVEKGDDDIANIMTELKRYILYKNRIQKQREHYTRNFFLYGTGIWHPIWDPSWKGGRGPNRWEGDIRVQSLHPQMVFPDTRCRSDIEEGVRIHKAFYRTVEYVKQKFGKEVMPDNASSRMNIAEDEPYRVNAGQDEEVLLVETWYKGEPLIKSKDDKDKKTDEDKHGMHVIWWCGDTSPTYLHHENYVYYDAGEDTKFPFIFRARYPRENSIWGFGEAWFLKQPQIALNKTAELILEGHMHFALGQTFYKPGAISPTQEKFLRQFGTLPNMYFAVNNIDQIKRIHGRGVDPALSQETQRLQRTMEGIIGRHDISQGRTPGSVVAFRALDLLAARARIRLRSAENAMITAYEDIGNYMNHLISRFYTERRAYRILGDDVERSEYYLIDMETGEEHPFTGQIPPGYELETRKVTAIKHGVFKPEDVMKVYIYDHTTGVEEVSPYTDKIAQEIDMIDLIKEGDMALSEDVIDVEAITVDYEVYCPELDVQCRVSTAAPTDRAFYMEMAKELLMAQLIDEETFWYVLQYGKFPPYETILQKRKEEIIGNAKMESKLAQKQAEQPMPQEGMPAEMPMEEPIEEGMPAEMPMEEPIEGGMPAQEFQMTPMLEQIFARRPDLWEKFNQLPPEAKQRVAAQLMSGSQEMV